MSGARVADAGGRTVHDEVAELFPDYVLGSLPEEDRRLVEGHVAGCERCRAELDAALVTSSRLFDAGPVDPAVRAALLARLDAEGRRAESATRSGARPTPLFGRRSQLGRVPRVVAALAAAVLLALGGWVAADRLDGGEGTVDRLTGNPEFAHSLTDTGAGSTAEGIAYVDPADDQAYVRASGLAPLPEGQGYQVWLFTEDGTQVSGGFVDADAEGEVAALVTAPEPFAAYVAVGLSAEPADGSSVAPTGPLALGGWIR